MELEKAIKSRKSVKKFSSKKPNWEDIIECIDSMRYAPMAGGNFTLKFILIEDKEAIAKISEASQQDFISKAHYVIVVCSTPARAVTLYGKRGEIYSRQQAGAAIQNFLLKIEEKKLATCWVGHFVEEHIKRDLGIPENSAIEAILPVGYEFKRQKPSEKINLDNVLYFKKYGNKRMKGWNTQNV